MSKMNGNAGEYDFLEQPTDEYFCPVTFALLLEPYQTRCCGNHLSREAYQRLQGKRCPVCREENLTAVDDKYLKRKVMSLKVRCPHKAEGCKWQGELGNLEEHLNSAKGCLFVDVDCPFSCGGRVQRRNLEEHKSQHCPKRPFACQYCNHEATFQEVTIEHWPVCEKFPLPCPNECGKKAIERQHLEGHLKQTCPLEVIQCDFSYAGCGAQLQRRLMSAHVKEGTGAHLSLVAEVSKHQADHIKKLENQIKQQADHIKKLEDQIQAILKLPVISPRPPLDIVMNDFITHQLDRDYWFSPPFYTHEGGYKMCLKVYANGCGDGEDTHVSVYVYLMKGEFDDDLKWPFPLDGLVTIELISKKKNARVFFMPQCDSIDKNRDDSNSDDSTNHDSDEEIESDNESDSDSDDDDDNERKQCVMRPVEKMNTYGWGIVEFLDLGDVEDDKLLFCVTDANIPI